MHQIVQFLKKFSSSLISYHFSSNPYFKLNLNLKENFDLTHRDTKGGRGVVFVGEGHVLIIVNY